MADGTRVRIALLTDHSPLLAHVTIDGTPTQDLKTAQDSAVDHRGPARLFNVSTIVSGIRCTFAYLILPFAAPFLGLSPSVGPILGLSIGAVALVANVYSIRRFWSSRHPWRKPVTVVHLGVIGLLVALAVSDIRSLL
jgi:hypothetical protein